MSGEIKKMADEEIIKWQEELYELERDCSTGPSMTEEEKMEMIKAFLADDYLEKLNAKIAARRKELMQEIAVTAEPRKKEHLQQKLALLSDF